MYFPLGLIDWSICLVVLGASILLGMYLAVRKKSSTNSSRFFLADRSLTWPLVGASLFATNIGAEHLVGLSGDAYRYGLSAGTVELTTFWTLGFAAMFLFPFYIRNKVFTTAEFLETRYHPVARVFFSGLMLAISITTKLAFHLYAGALVLRGLSGWNVMTVVWVMGAIAACVTIIGGFPAVAYTDSIQAGIIIVGCTIMVFTGLHRLGGWHELVFKAPLAMHIAKPYTDPNYPFWGVLLTAVYGGTFYWGVDQVNVQRVLGARDIKQARWGAMFAVLLKLSPVFIFAVPGVIALALFPGARQQDHICDTAQRTAAGWDPRTGSRCPACVSHWFDSICNEFGFHASGAGLHPSFSSANQRASPSQAGKMRDRCRSVARHHSDLCHLQNPRWSV